MMSSRNLNLNGLKLSGSEPASPRTSAFMQYHGMQAKYNQGSGKDVVEVTGNYFLPTQEISEFHKNKEEYLARRKITY